MNNTTKDIKNGNISIGSCIQSGNTVTAEILANCCYNWIAFDLGHTETGFESFANILRAISKYDVLPMARVSENDTITIRRVLDCGAKGVIVPLINNRDDAVKAVKSTKYPPEGIRGFAFIRVMNGEKILTNMQRKLMMRLS